ncbi:transcriptional regulator [bacterium]|nr:transcriptional regulator [bacterium]
MQLKDYFENKPHGSMVEFAKQLGITKTWLSLILNGRKQPSASLCAVIERLTNKKVKRKELRPDLFGEV